MPDKKLVAKIKSEDMKTMAETVSMITNVSEDTAPILLKIKDSSLQVSIESTEAASTLDVPAEVTDMAVCEFFYNAKYFGDMLKVIRGDVDIYMTGNGILYVSNSVSEYMLVNSKQRKVKVKAKKTHVKTKKVA